MGWRQAWLWLCYQLIDSNPTTYFVTERQLFYIWYAQNKINLNAIKIHLNINLNWVNLYYLEYVKLLLLGVCYIVLEKSNNPDKVADYAASYGFENSIVIERRAGREYLLVMKLVRK